MAVCNYYLRGQCKFGDSCRNEHPANSRDGGFRAQSWTNPNQSANNKVPLPFTIDSVTNDLSPGIDKPIWPLSSYGPAKYEPILIGGQDESPEELRVKAVAAIRAGSLNEYLSYESEKISLASQVFSNALANVTQAYDQAAKQSPIPALLAGQTSANATTGQSAFGAQPAQGSTQSAFSNTAPPTFGNTTTTSAFGKPSFGQPAFGQSAFGQTTAPASTSAFGQSATPKSAFGQPTSSFGTSAFGQTSQPTSTSGFGQSSLIKPATGAFSAFGNSGTSSPFGAKPAAAGGFSAFANQPTGFGTTSSNSTPQTGNSVFGQTGFASGTAPTQGNVFGTAAQGSALGAPAQPAQPAFGQQSAPVSAFGTPAFGATTNANNAVSSGSVFGSGGSGFSNTFNQSGAFGGQSGTSGSAFGAPPQSSAFSTGGQAATSSFFPVANSTSFAMSEVQHSPINPSSNPGPPDFTSVRSTFRPGKTPYDQQLPPNYMEVLPASALEAFKSQKFEWGKVPDWIPPIELR